MRTAMFLILAMICSPAQAMDADQARAALVGTWVSELASVTWIFGDDGSWAQYTGGETSDARYALSTMPANMVRLGTSNGRSFVLHFGYKNERLSMYPLGSSELIITLAKQ